MYNIEEKMQALKRLQEAIDACRKVGIDFNTDIKPKQEPKQEPKQAAATAPMPAPAPNRVGRTEGPAHNNIERIVRALAVKGKISVTQVRKEAKKMGFNVYSVGQSLRRLEEMGVVARDGDTITLL